MKLIDSGVEITEEILGHICGGAITVASAILPGFSKNWEWDFEDLGPLVPVRLGTPCLSAIRLVALLTECAFCLTTGMVRYWLHQ